MLTPWKLTKQLSQTNNLFQDENLPYLVDGYRCSCGAKSIVIRNDKESKKKRCSECDNELFFDVDLCTKQAFWYDYFFESKAQSKWTVDYDDIYDDFVSSIFGLQEHLDSQQARGRKSIETLPFHFKTIFKKENETVYILYGFEHIYTIDLAADSFQETFFSIYKYGIDLSSGENTYNYMLEIDEKIQYDFQLQLFEYLQLNDLIDFPFVKQIRTLNQLSFFLQNKHLIEYQFINWRDISFIPNQPTTIQQGLDLLLVAGGEKSVRKELYKNYERQLTTTRRFTTVFIKPFLSLIKDCNIRVNLLKMDFPHLEEEYFCIDKFVSFLLLHNYSEKQIYDFLNKIDFDSDKDMSLFKDTMQLFNDLLIEPSYFKKVRCTLSLLHDEFIRATREVYLNKIYTQKLHYTKQERATCKKVREYHIKVPRDGYMLYKWSDLLHNCLSGYFHRILDKQTTVYGFFQGKELVFAVEIRDKMIIQASSKWNAKLNETQKEALMFWYKNIYMRQSEREK